MAVIPIKHLPLGFRFHPTDAELINHYLKRKINGRIRSDPVAVIPEIDVCKSEPWDLPDKALIQSGDGEWFFFAPRDRKYVNSARHNRATEAGYWKATGKDRVIRGRGGEGKGAVEIGRKKTLVFHRGRAPKGERTGWIMHEYRTVEPEFETGEEGQFVLCRLFKKLEENNSSSNADELESGGFSPAPTKSSASDTQHGPDTPEEFGTRPPESNLQQNLQALPLSALPPSAHSQPLGTQSRVCNEADCSTTYSSKPEESHSTSSTVSDLADHWGSEDVLPQFIGEHCSNGGPSFSSPLVAIDEDLLFHDYSSTGWLQDADADANANLQDADANANPDANADLEYLESLLNDEEDDFSDLFNIQNDFVDAVEPVYQVCPTMFPPLDLKPYKDSGTSSMMDVEPVFTQEHSQAYGSGMIHPLLFAPNVELNTSHSYPEREAQINLIREASPWEMTGQSVPWVDVSSMELASTRSIPERLYDTGAECFPSFSRNMEDQNTPVGPSLTGINIKYRQPRLRSRNTDEVQGTAVRRLRLQSRDSKTDFICLQSCDSKTDFVVKAAPEEGEHSEHQIAEKREISCSVLEELKGLSDNDDSTYLETKPIPESAQESKPSVRLRKKLTNDLGKEPEGKTSHRQTHGSVSINKVIMPLFVFLLLLCVGTWYHIYF